MRELTILLVILFTTSEYSQIWLRIQKNGGIDSVKLTDISRIYFTQNGQPNSIDTMNVSENFDYTTQKNIHLSLTVDYSENQVLQNVPIKLYDKDPDVDGKLIGTTISDDNGIAESNLTIPTYIKEMYATSDYIGLPQKIKINISGSDISLKYSEGLAAIGNAAKVSNFTNSLNKEQAVSYKTLGTWNNDGVPSYLTKPNDVIDQTLLNNINASLPERVNVMTLHPQYLATSNETSTVLDDSAEVTVTFIHEGAGYRNALGFYTYTKGTPPTKISDIQSTMTLIFPNCSYTGSGGGLASGNKVVIGRFPKNTVIGWFLLANGFTGGTANSFNPSWTFFSDEQLNLETNATLKQHNVLLADQTSKKYILGFEDIARENAGSDQDFNDVLFNVTANPFVAINTTNLPPLDIPKDDDNDGITNTFDEYPTDGSRAFNNYSPAKNVYGSLVFEDLWPAKGDFDFNDMVIDYKMNRVTNAKNQIVDLIINVKLRAIGAGYKNGFGIELPIVPSSVKSVEETNLTTGKIIPSTLEAGQAKAVIIVFDDAYAAMNAGGPNYVNTVMSEPKVPPVEFQIKVSFTTPLAFSTLAAAPFNPFIFINKERGKEVHLPDMAPTTLADLKYFRTLDDNSNRASGKYYKTTRNQPWALNISESITYPTEKSAISNAFLYFVHWAESNGNASQDWYLDKSGYRNNLFIYK